MTFQPCLSVNIWHVQFLINFEKLSFDHLFFSYCITHTFPLHYRTLPKGLISVFSFFFFNWIFFHWKKITSIDRVLKKYLPAKYFDIQIKYIFLTFLHKTGRKLYISLLQNGCLVSCHLLPHISWPQKPLATKHCQKIIMTAKWTVNEEKTFWLKRFSNSLPLPLRPCLSLKS